VIFDHGTTCKNLLYSADIHASHTGSNYLFAITAWIMPGIPKLCFEWNDIL
jgi:hypothetical protein